MGEGGSGGRVLAVLLRGVNVGGRNRLPMGELRSWLTAAGFEDVRTLLHSGNAVLRTPLAGAEVGALVRAVVLERSGLAVPVVVRTPGQLRDVLAWCPFADAPRRPTLVHVLHLDREPGAERLAALLDDGWAPDALAARGCEIVVRYDHAAHSSRLQAALVLRRLRVDGTARNWRTLQALVDLTASAGAA